jgi:hypothetical protein
MYNVKPNNESCWVFLLNLKEILFMEILSDEEFLKLLYAYDTEIIGNLRVNLSKELRINLVDVNLKISFHNIVFSGFTVRFFNSKEECLHSINFTECTFLSDLEFNYCNLYEINFLSNTFNSQKLNIYNSKISNFSSKTNNIFEKGNLEIDKCEFESLFDLEKIKFINYSSLKIKESSFNGSVSIVDCEINQLIISHCYFRDHFDYFGNKSNSNNNSSFFNRCEFNHSSFFKTKLNNDTHFANCKFLNETKFESTGDEIKTILRFDDCEFLKQVSFNKSRIHKISFNNLKFYDIASLQETYFDIIDIDRTIFDKQANFDDIQIKQIYNCNRRTIRTIKLQLQKAENKIDYNKFRVYEFNAYRDDIQKKLKEFKKDKDYLNHRRREPIQLKRDAFILWISDLVSEYGTDWKRALKFTFLSGLVAFTLFYILENIKLVLDINNWQDFIYGYLRFFLITDFKNEYFEAGESVLKFNSFLSLFPFILGKIAVAFGIYETIQSFRKFKA